MNIIVEKHGHQHYSKFKGVVLGWTQTVSYFNKKPFQVPAVILQTEREIKIIPLKKELYHYIIKKEE